MSSIDRSRRRVAAAAGLGAALTWALAGCATAPGPQAKAQARPPAATPLDQYPIQLQETPERLALAVHADGAISPAQEAALAAFAQGWREAGGDAPMVVEAPVNGAAAPDPKPQVYRLAARLGALAGGPEAVRLASYDAGGAPGAPIVVRYDRLSPEALDCTSKWDNLVATRDNSVSKHFGCAMSKNMAAMIADPRDLRRPRAMTPADAGRRAIVLDKYRQGVVTSSAKDDQAQGVISQTAK